MTIGALLSAFGRSFEATIVALFPSIFIPIMVGTWISQGKAVTAPKPNKYTVFWYVFYGANRYLLERWGR